MATTDVTFDWKKAVSVSFVDDAERMEEGLKQAALTPLLQSGKAWEELSATYGQVGESLKRAFAPIERSTFREGWDNATSTFASSMDRITEAKLREITSFFEQTDKVKIKELLGVASSATSVTNKELLDHVLTRLRSTSKLLLDNLESFTMSVYHDPAIKEAVYGLEEMQRILAMIDAIGGVYSMVKSVVDIYEPLSPYIEIIVNASMIFWTGGTSAIKVTKESALQAIKELSKLLPLILKPLKEYVMNLELELPSWILGEVRQLRSAFPAEWDSVLSLDWLDAKSEAAQKAKEITGGVLSDRMYNSIIDEINDRGLVLNHKAISDWLEGPVLIKGSSIITKILADAESYNKLTYRLSTSAYWDTPASSRGISDSEGAIGTVVVTAGGTGNEATGGTNALMTTVSDVKAISKELYEAMRVEESSFFSNKEMHKLIVQHLIEDGAVADIEDKTYDELATYKGGRAARAAFTLINNRIINNHLLMRALTGEVRANIYETIPVIDFYRKEYTGVHLKYVSDKYGDITETHPFTDVVDVIALAPGEAAPTASETITPDHDPYDAPSYRDSTLNLALMEYPIALHFFGTTSAISEEPSIQVEGPTLGTPKASGLLNGLFTSIAEATTDGAVGGTTTVNKWQWYDDEAEDHVQRAEANGVSIATGARYNEAHLLNRGTIVAYPLAAANPSLYGGRAEELFTELYTQVDDQLISNHEVDVASWKTLGGILHMITASPHAKVTTRVEHYREIQEERYGFLKLKRRIVEVQKTRTIEESDARYPEKINYFTKNPDRLTASRWNNVLDPTGTTLTINSSNADVVTQWRGTKSVNVFLWIIYKSIALQDTITSESALFEVFINNEGKRVEKVLVMMPLETLANKALSVSKSVFASVLTGAPSTALIFPDASDNASLPTAFPSKMVLLSKKELGFEATGKKSLCSFVTNDVALISRVTKVSKVSFDPENASCSVVYGGSTYHSDSETVFTKVGSDCWFYELEAIELSYQGTTLDVFPLKGGVLADGAFFAGGRTTSGLYALQNREDSLKALLGASIVVGLPKLTGNQRYEDFALDKAKATSMYRLGAVLDDVGNIVKRAVYDSIANSPIMKKTVNGVARDLPLKKLNDLTSPWLNADRALMQMIAEGVVEASDVATMRSTTIARFRNINATINAFTKSDAPLTLDICKHLDRHLGNAATTPWLSIGTGPEHDISETTLSTIAAHIYRSLEGVPDEETAYAVRYIKGDHTATGRKDSLYYQRYKFLNSRLHRSNGSLARAVMLKKNWDYQRKAITAEADKVESYRDFVEIIPLNVATPLEYIDDSLMGKGEVVKGQYSRTVEDVIIGGNFYYQNTLDEVRTAIGERCLLVCRPCPVKDLCPFYDENSVILGMLPPADSLELWVKDNELDLLVYENDGDGDYLNVVAQSADGRRLDAALLQDIHLPFTEIRYSDEKTRLLEDLREDVARKINGFTNDIESFGWLQGGRYGSIVKGRVHGEESTDPADHSYLYDALFIDDHETYVSYEASENQYPVHVEMDNGDVYQGTVRIKIPKNLSILAQANSRDKVYLVSDDEVDSEGKPFDPVVYINTVGQLKYAFDLKEDSPDEEILRAKDGAGPRAKDIAQWCVNMANTFSSKKDQWWKPEIEKKIPSASSSTGFETIRIAGRPRATTVIDPLRTTEPPIGELLRGRPVINVHSKFLRRFLISFDCFLWSEEDNAAAIERAKKALPLMRTNLRLVVVKLEDF